MRWTDEVGDADAGDGEGDMDRGDGEQAADEPYDQ